MKWKTVLYVWKITSKVNTHAIYYFIMSGRTTQRDFAEDFTIEFHEWKKYWMYQIACLTIIEHEDEFMLLRLVLKGACLRHQFKNVPTLMKECNFFDSLRCERYHSRFRRMVKKGTYLRITLSIQPKTVLIKNRTFIQLQMLWVLHSNSHRNSRTAWNLSITI